MSGDLASFMQLLEQRKVITMEWDEPVPLNDPGPVVGEIIFITLNTLRYETVVLTRDANKCTTRLVTWEQS